MPTMTPMSSGDRGSSDEDRGHDGQEHALSLGREEHVYLQCEQEPGEGGDHAVHGEEL